MAMQGMRDLLKGALGKSLEALSDEDKLAAAWPVACGKAMAERGTIIAYQNGIVLIAVTDSAWLQQFRNMRGQLASEMARIAAVQVTEIHFQVKR
jgi:Dna[CI] antecedent, DciA